MGLFGDGGGNEELDAFFLCLVESPFKAIDARHNGTCGSCQRFSPHPPAPYSPQIRV